MVLLTLMDHMEMLESHHFLVRERSLDFLAQLEVYWMLSASIFCEQVLLTCTSVASCRADIM